ncbi:MAG: DUF542 domain-containing protein [Planctomycetota bacterium]
MTNEPMTLASLAVSRPGATRVFLEHQIDFCCHGRRTLQEACASAGLDAAALRCEIEALDRKPTVLTELPSQPLDQVIHHVIDRYPRLRLICRT